MTETIQLSHGGGGQESAALIRDLFYRTFENDILLSAEDSAVLTVDKEIAFTTDGYTVSPLFFPGGNIGKLAVAGTCNDLAMMGAKPLYLSAAFIIEEGLAFSELEQIVKTMGEELKKCGARIVCGDTKVVPRGSADKLFITTTGIGEIRRKGISAHNLRESDTIIVSRDVGRHGATILTEREELGAGSALESDCEVLWGAVEALIEGNISVTAMRDATRGGLAAVLNEWAEASDICIELEERSIPVCDEVRGMCELFGFDAFDFANEGTFVLAVPPMHASFALEILKRFDYCAEAAIIGRVTAAKPGKVMLYTPHGSSRYLELPKGELLPRIC